MLKNHVLVGVAWAAVAAVAPAVHGQCELAWSPLGSGIDGQWVNALVAFDDGSGGGPALHVGGSFTAAGGAPAAGIAKWDGSGWSPLGSGLGPASVVNDLTVFDDGGGPALYAGGAFGAGNVAKWDGNDWAPLAGGVDGPVSTLAVYDDGGGPALYAGGVFRATGGVAASGIAKWDGAAWSALGGGVDGGVNALAVFDDGSGPALYVGGEFATADGVAVSGIAKWDGSRWSDVGGGVSGGLFLGVFVLAVFDDGAGPALYAGGDFTVAGGVEVSRIARWDGAEWSDVGGGVGQLCTCFTSVDAMTVFDDGSGGGPALYVGGVFETAGSVAASDIARWDGAMWSALGAGMTDSTGVAALAVFDDGSGGGPALYAGGQFQMAGSVDAKSVARWGCEAEACFADCDSSGALNFFDFLCFQNLFAAGDPGADCDGSGDLSFFDFLCFQDGFAAGCL